MSFSPFLVKTEYVWRCKGSCSAESSMGMISSGSKIAINVWERYSLVIPWAHAGMLYLVQSLDVVEGLESLDNRSPRVQLISFFFASHV